MDNEWRTREPEEPRRGKPFSEQETNVFKIRMFMVIIDGAILFICGFGIDGWIASNLFSGDHPKIERIDIEHD